MLSPPGAQVGDIFDQRSTKDDNEFLTRPESSWKGMTLSPRLPTREFKTLKPKQAQSVFVDDSPFTRNQVHRRRPSYLRPLTSEEYEERSRVRLTDLMAHKGSKESLAKPKRRTLRIESIHRLEKFRELQPGSRRIPSISVEDGELFSEELDFHLLLFHKRNQCCMKLKCSANLTIRDIWELAANTLGIKEQKLQSQSILTYQFKGEKFQIINQTQFLKQTHFFKCLQKMDVTPDSIPLIVETVPKSEIQDIAGIRRINKLIGSKFDHAILPEKFFNPYNTEERDLYLARRTLNSAVREMVFHRIPEDYALSMEIDTSEINSILKLMLPGNGLVDVTFHIEKKLIKQKISVYSTANDIFKDVISKVTNSDFRSRSSYKLNFTKLLNKQCFQICGEEIYLSGDITLIDFAIIRKLLFKQLEIHLAIVDRPQADKVHANIWPRVDPCHYDTITDDNLKKINSSSVEAYQNIKVVSIKDANNVFRVYVDGIMKLDLTHLEQCGVKSGFSIYVQLGLYHGNQPLTRDVLTSMKQISSSGTIMIKELVSFDKHVKDLPKETKLLVNLCACKTNGINIQLFWGLLNIADTNDNTLKEGKQLLYLWPSPDISGDKYFPTTKSELVVLPPVRCPSQSAVQLSIIFDSRVVPAIFPGENEADESYDDSEKMDLDDVFDDPDDILEEGRSGTAQKKKKLLQHGRRRSTLVSSPTPGASDKSNKAITLQVGRVKKFSLIPDQAPKKTLLFPSVKQRKLELEDAFQLLDCECADSGLRKAAASKLKVIPPHDMKHYLLPLLQALKFEWRLDNALSRYLLHVALKNKFFGNLFFWTLRSEVNHPMHGMHYAILLEAYLGGCGEAMLAMFESQLSTYEKFQKIGQKVLAADKKDDKTLILKSLLAENSINQIAFRPLYNHRVVLGELDWSKSKVMRSKKKPIWLDMKNISPTVMPAVNRHCVILKQGDDLRQDMLTLRLLELFERIWQEDNLDLRLLPYKCIATSSNSGLIEVVLDSQTLGSISETEVRNEKKLYEWIREQQRDTEGEVDLDKLCEALKKFVKSLAAYSVATYVLGITDRHNDNIMINKHGQMFHIDFGHFLGNFKQFLGFQREWSPFILTPDFVYAMGGEQGKHFETYKNLSVRGYLSLRRRGEFIINLVSLMRHAGIPELSSRKDMQYLLDALNLKGTEEEAEKSFLNEMDKSRSRSWTVQLNWWIHVKAARNS